jgi:hypothetical protein
MQVDAIGEPYNITLDSRAVPLKALESPLKVLCFRIRNKHIEMGGFEALLTHLSAKEGKLLLEGAADKLTVFDELRMRLFDREVLAKITAIENQDTVTLWFGTSPACPLAPEPP